MSKKNCMLIISAWVFHRMQRADEICRDRSTCKRVSSQTIIRSRSSGQCDECTVSLLLNLFLFSDVCFCPDLHIWLLNSSTLVHVAYEIICITAGSYTNKLVQKIFCILKQAGHNDQSHTWGMDRTCVRSYKRFKPSKQGMFSDLWLMLWQLFLINRRFKH